MPALAVDRARSQLDALAGAGLDWRTFGTAAVETLRRAMPFAACCLATLDPGSELVTGTVKWGDLDDDHDQQWSFFEYEVEDVYDFRSICRRPGAVAALCDETGGDPRRSRRFEEMFAPVWDYSDELRAGLRCDGASWGALALFHQGGRRFTDADQELVGALTTAFARGLRAGLIAGAVDLVGGGDAGPAVLVVDRDDEVAQANPAASTRLVALGGGPAGSRLPQVVVTLVAAARRFSSVPGAPVPRARLRDGRGRWLVAHASPLLGRGGEVGEVVVTLEAARPPEIVPLVVASYGLTSRERDVVGMVLQGVDTAEIARTLHLSAWTVQDHLKKIFTKVGVRSRREVIARVYSDHYVPKLIEGAALAPAGWFA